MEYALGAKSQFTLTMEILPVEHENSFNNLHTFLTLQIEWNLTVWMVSMYSVHGTLQVRYRSITGNTDWIKQINNNGKLSFVPNCGKRDIKIEIVFPLSRPAVCLFNSMNFEMRWAQSTEQNGLVILYLVFVVDDDSFGTQSIPNRVEPHKRKNNHRMNNRQAHLRNQQFVFTYLVIGHIYSDVRQSTENETNKFEKKLVERCKRVRVHLSSLTCAPSMMIIIMLVN